MSTMIYPSPVGKLRITGDAGGVSRLEFYRGDEKPSDTVPSELGEICRWLDIYFSGGAPDFLPQIKPEGTAFQKDVWRRLLKIPYGKTATYGDIAKEIASERGIKRMSARAVGNAVGKNPIGIVIPCHRVVAANGIGGFGGHLEDKIYLLGLEAGKERSV